MVNLSRQEIVFLESQLVNVEQVPTELPIRLKSAEILPGDSQQLELSEDSAEALLDCLPLPPAEAAIDLTDLRTRLQEFLHRLRFSQDPT